MGIVLLIVGAVALWVVRAIRCWMGTYFVHTTERCFIVRQTGLFANASRDLPLGAVEQVDASQNGVFSGIWGYGTLTLVMTSGERVVVDFLPHITDVADGVRG